MTLSVSGSCNASCARSAHRSGMILAAAAFALLTSVDIIFKLMAEHHPAYQILFVNGCFASIPILAWAMLTGGIRRFYTRRPLLHLARGSVSVLSAFCAVYAYSRLRLTNYYAILFAGPLIVMILSAWLLHEKMDRGHWAAAVAGFVGVLVVINPFTDMGYADGEAAWGRLAALLSVFCYAVSVLMIRRMRLGETNLTFAFYGYVASLAIGGALLFLLDGPPMRAGDFVRLALSGFLAGLSSICLLTAYHRSPVALVAPFQYTQICWGALGGWLIWSHVPDMHVAAGAAIVAGSGLYVIFREMRGPEKSGWARRASFRRPLFAPRPPR
ncbi:MAG: DMT family transporter [Bdellovibrionales bacterium]